MQSAIASFKLLKRAIAPLKRTSTKKSPVLIGIDEHLALDIIRI
jgi:hypothetical protein